MITRRAFLKTTLAAGGVYLLKPADLIGQIYKTNATYFGVHPFIEMNPDAVFIMRSNVDVKTNGAAIKEVGLNFGQSVFTLTDDEQSGVPLSQIFNIKPNLVGRYMWEEAYTREGTMGIITDAYFVEGVIESMKALGIGADQIYIRDTNGEENLIEGGYQAMAERTGVDVQMLLRNPFENYTQDQIQWRDVPEGKFFKRIAYLWPINAPDSWLLNIAKFKTHAMGMTLCAKNIQGTCAFPYVRHCRNYYWDFGIDWEHIQSGALINIQESYNAHKAAGIPRWDKAGSDAYSGLGMETWATRCLDNHSATKPGLHVIEGVYGRDGHFVVGPNDGLALDYMTNIIIFGKNPFYVDIIGHWLGGHEPGNFGLFHLARERGFIENFNPNDIQLYEWNEEGEATTTDLTNYDRFSLKTNYLRKTDEDEWHLCNEPYNYSATVISKNTVKYPANYILQQNYPNPFNPSTTITFSLPKSGRARIEIFNTRGQIIDIPYDQYTSQGNHMIVWRAKQVPSGTYFYRFNSGSFSETKRMTLVR